MFGAMRMRPDRGSGTPGTPATQRRTRSKGTACRLAAVRHMRAIWRTTYRPPRASVGSISSARIRHERSAMAARVFVPPRSTAAMHAASGTTS